MEWLKWLVSKVTSPFTTNPLPKVRWLALMLTITAVGANLPFTNLIVIGSLIGAVAVGTLLLSMLYERRSWRETMQWTMNSAVFLPITLAVIMLWGTQVLGFASVFAGRWALVILAIAIDLVVAWKVFGLTKRRVFTAGAICIGAIAAIEAWQHAGTKGIEIIVGLAVLGAAVHYARKAIIAARAGARPSRMAVAIGAAALVVAGLGGYAIFKFGLVASVSVAVIVAMGVGFLLFRRHRALAAAADTPRRSALAVVVDGGLWFGKRLAILAPFAAATVWLVAMNTQETMIHWQMASSLNPKIIAALPDSGNGTVGDARLATLFTARANTTNAAHDNLITTPDPQFYVNDGKPVFVGVNYRTIYGLVFVERMLHLNLSYVDTVVTINAKVFKATDVLEKQLGVGFPLSDQNTVIRGLFVLRHFGATPGEATYVHDGYLIPVIRYFPTKMGGMRPVVTGQMRVRAHLQVDDLSMKDAQRLYPNVQLDPNSVLREYAKAYAFYNAGLSDVLWSQNDVMEIAEGEHASDPLANIAPYRQVMADGQLYSVFALKPQGKSKNLRDVLFFSATGGLDVFRVPTNWKDLIAPSQAYDQVSSALKNMDWSNKTLADPRLVVHSVPGATQPQVFWLFTIVTKEGYSAVATVVVDARTQDATAFDNDQEVAAWFTKLYAGEVK